MLRLAELFGEAVVTIRQFVPSTFRHLCRSAQMPIVERKRRWLGRGLQLAALLPCCLGLPSHSEPAPSQTEATPKRETGAYGRLGAGVAWPQTDGFRDGNCASKQPAALFGCGAGNDGRRLGATGGFNPALAVDGALGYRFNRWIRAEALVSWLPDLEFQGQSNFRGAAGSNQPVNGAVSSVAGFGVAYVDLPRVGEVRPFLGAGLGVARNRIEALNFRFPGIAPTAITTIPGGSTSDLAYLLTAGISLPLSGRLDLDLAYRFSDLGSVKTSGGQAQVVRPARTFSIPIGGTTSYLKTHGLVVSLRYAF